MIRIFTVFALSVVAFAVWQWPPQEASAAPNCSAESWAFLLGRSHSALENLSLPARARMVYSTESQHSDHGDVLWVHIDDAHNITEVYCG